MQRPTQTTLTRGPGQTIAAMGDSLTHNFALGVAPDQFWPTQLAQRLQAQNYGVQARNFARSGNTTAQMIARFGHMTRYDVPALAIVWGGANDPGNAITTAQTQANLETMIQTLLDAGTRMILIGTTQYLNWAAGGDTPAAQGATYAAVRSAQHAAVVAKQAANGGKVAVCDTYAFMRNLIVTGTETQGSASWHVAPTDQHLNALGNRYVADAMLAAITAQTGWLDRLRA